MQIEPAMQAQAKALADPSRFRIFEFIARAEHLVTVAELTDLLGFNHNAIRQHLAVLTHAELVTESNEVRKTPGRPRKHYRLRNDALRAFRSVSGSYERLAHLLLELHQTQDDPYEVGRREGARSASLAASGDTTNLLHVLAREGFAPLEITDTTIELTHCPFAEVAGRNPDVVCELHRGLIAGALQANASEAVATLTPKPPHTAGCLVQLTLPELGND